VRARAPIYAFNGGEISRRMEGRADLDGNYDRAVARMRNFVPTVEGPALKRSGFRFINAEDATATWIRRFVFNVTQSYFFVFCDSGTGGGKIRFYTNGGRIEIAPGVPFELLVPYPAAIARRLSVKQSYDRLYIAHPDYPPGMITRTGAESFTFETIPFEGGPFKDWNTDRTKTITVSGVLELNGAALITATQPIFDPLMVGAPFIYEVEGFSEIPAWQPQVRSNTLTLGDKRRSDGKVYECDSLTTVLGPSEYTGTIEPTHTSGSEWDGPQQILECTEDDYVGVRWKYLYDRYGAGEITGVTDAYNATIRVTRRLPDLTAATHKWALPWMSGFDGYPQLIDVWGQRLILWKEVELAGSVTGKYFDFSPIDKSGIFAPDQAFRRRLDAPDPPMWSHADKNYLLAGTASGELVVGQINQAAGLSGDNIRADLQSSYGSSDTWPIAIGTSILFVQRGGRKIREAEFSNSQERFVGANLNIYARHITKSGIRWVAFQQEPEEMLWCGRGDGTLIAHPHSPEQQVKGFARIELAQGTVLSGTTIPSPDGSKDELWILADRDGERAILQLADWWDEDAGLAQADAFFVDWGVSYDGNAIDPLTSLPFGPKSEFTTGLEHLEGETVRILADGVVVEDLVVTGGALTLDTAATKVHIGLPYTAELKLLRPEIRGIPTAQGLRKRLLRRIARLIDAGGLILKGEYADRDRFTDRQNNLAMNGPPPLFNGDTDNLPVGDGSSYDPIVEILSDDPLPCMIAQLLPTYELEELNR
jgi:hypothetical protein